MQLNKNTIHSKSNLVILIFINILKIVHMNNGIHGIKLRYSKVN